jgi:polyhydroxyalkanoate synthesis repressor PhaR
MAEPIVLKKYANRRLYDTAQSTYVTLDEVADMIQTGKTVRAIDAKTKEDVTGFILTQIMLERARKKNIFLPVSLLHTIIRYGDNVLMDFFDNYLEQTINNYLAYKSQVDEQFKKWLDFGQDLSGMAKKSMADLSPFSPFFNKGTASDKDKED